MVILQSQQNKLFSINKIKNFSFLLLIFAKFPNIKKISILQFKSQVSHLLDSSYTCALLNPCKIRVYKFNPKSERIDIFVDMHVRIYQILQTMIKHKKFPFYFKPLINCHFIKILFLNFYIYKLFIMFVLSVIFGTKHVCQNWD